ncbi:hypothetical protein SDJN03_30304, partial [Cucurbita argyrosperma subsp. sororia]
MKSKETLENEGGDLGEEDGERKRRETNENEANGVVDAVSGPRAKLLQVDRCRVYDAAVGWIELTGRCRYSRSVVESREGAWLSVGVAGS